MDDRELLRAAGGDPVKAGRFKAGIAEYRARCEEIDRRLEEAQGQALREAYAALMAGDTARRARLCRAAEELPERAAAARLEVGLRIGEALGLDRDAVERVVRRKWAEN